MRQTIYVLAPVKVEINTDTGDLEHAELPELGDLESFYWALGSYPTLEEAWEALRTHLPMAPVNLLKDPG